jgi:hypothetical protein
MESPKFKSIVLVKHNEKELVYDVNHPTPTKILVINTTVNFDIFTQKYAYVGEYNFLYIDWAKVRKDFGGVKIDEKPGGTLWDDRFFSAPLNGTQYGSWWDAEFYDRIFI